MCVCVCVWRGGGQLFFNENCVWGGGEGAGIFLSPQILTYLNRAIFKTVAYQNLNKLICSACANRAAQ